MAPKWFSLPNETLQDLTRKDLQARGRCHPLPPSPHRPRPKAPPPPHPPKYGSTPQTFFQFSLFSSMNFRCRSDFWYSS